MTLTVLNVLRSALNKGELSASRPGALSSPKKPPGPIGYQNAGHALPLSNSRDTIKIVRAVSSLLSCTQRALYVGVDMRYSTLVRDVLNVCYLWIASEQVSQRERDKGIHYTVLAAITLFPEFISSCICVWQSE